MSKTATIAIGVNVITPGLQQQESAGPFTNASSPGQITQVTLLGSDQITIPAGQFATVIMPPASMNGSTLTIRNLVGDSPIPIDSVYPSIIPIDSTQTAVYLGTSMATAQLPVAFV